MGKSNDRKGKAKVYAEISNPDDDDKKTASNETLASINRIKIFRVVLLVSLVITGIVSGVLSYIILDEKENDKYNSAFESAVHEIFLAVDEGFNSKVVTLDHMSTLDSFHCPYASQWPNCSMELNYYEAITSTLIDISDSRSIASNPLVYPHQKESFENFAYEKFENENYPPNTGISSFGRGFYAKYENGSRYADDGRSDFSNYVLYLPVFLPADVSKNWPGIMFNMHSEPIRAAAIDAVLDCSAGLTPSTSSIVQRCTAVSDFIQLVSDSTPRPASIIYSPVFPLHNNDTLVAINTIIFNWDDILMTTDSFGHGSIQCDVETTQGVGGDSLATHSFCLTSGSVTYEGDGAQRSGGPSERISVQLSYRTEIATAVTYSLHFHPNGDFYRAYHTWIPIWACVVCILITAFISILFLIYDRVVKRESIENKMLLDSKRVFVRFVSHEIRTPINTITLGLQLLAARIATLAPPTLSLANAHSLQGGSDHSPSHSQRISVSDSSVTPTTPTSSGGRVRRRSSHNHKKYFNKVTPSDTDTVTECLELVGELTESSKTAVVVLNELINYDKVEMQKFHIERRLCDVLVVLRDTVRPLEVQAKQREVKLKVERDSHIESSLFVIGDAVKLGQVIRNVLSNALKFAPVGSTVCLKVRWKTANNPEDDLIRLDPVTGDEYSPAGDFEITVTDTGPGLSAEQQKKMFQEGVQFNANELQAGGGSGLGLWISREIVKQHGGAIGVKSDGLGKGSTFTISIPVLLPLVSKSYSRRLVYSTRLENNDVQAVEVPSRVLVVDDAITSVKILSRLLVNAGMEVTKAFDGKECIDCVNECPGDESFDLIIMDFEMPVMNGPDATRALREQGVTVPIIGVTGNVLPEDREYFLSCGANFVLPKPLDLASLLSCYSEYKCQGEPGDDDDEKLVGGRRKEARNMKRALSNMSETSYMSKGDEGEDSEV